MKAPTLASWQRAPSAKVAVCAAAAPKPWIDAPSDSGINFLHPGESVVAHRSGPGVGSLQVDANALAQQFVQISVCHNKLLDTTRGRDFRLLLERIVLSLLPPLARPAFSMIFGGTAFSGPHAPGIWAVLDQPRRSFTGRSR